ncbi:hypothetical protein U1Q18_052618 [Sarracenia purpurea var. burkii]
MTAAEYNQYMYGQMGQSMSSSEIPVAIFADNPTACVVILHTWVMDSGASTHMAGLSGILSSYKSIPGHVSVLVTNGSSFAVKGCGVAIPTSALSLYNVLHTPDSPFNLLSSSQITIDLNCSVTFFPDSYVFQDLSMKRTISRGHGSSGLYLLDVAPA